MTDPPFTCVVPVALVVRDASGAVPPTALLNMVVPAVFTVTSNAPSSVSTNRILLPPLLVSVVLAPTVTASL